MTRVLGMAVTLVALWGGVGVAQKPDGYVSAGFDALPQAAGSPVELRVRLFADQKITLGPRVTLRLAGGLDWLGLREFVRDDVQVVPFDGRENVEFVPAEVQAEFSAARGDLRLGYSRVVWGRLDEVQPSDLVNPLDLARFVFEGRAEARLAVPMARGRLFFGERASVEALIVPYFTRGRFDHLHEPSSPFNLQREALSAAAPPGASVALSRLEPPAALENMQGGGRLAVTTGRVDWALSFYRGFDSFGVWAAAAPLDVVHVFPRYTMMAGDFETTKGQWALRGEVARLSGGVDAIDGGLGFDRRAGEYQVSGTVLIHHEGDVSPLLDSYTAASLVAAANRSFARERYRTRVFGVYNATEGAVFVRNITSMEVRANVTLEGSLGWFLGSGSPRARRDLIGRFGDRDFLYARLRVHF